MKMNYDGKKFKPLSISENGEVSEEVIFHYKQAESLVSCTYGGGKIKQGQLIGIVNREGVIDMRYQQVLKDGTIQTGQCISTPEFLENGKTRLHEKWKWTCGDFSEGESMIEEI